MRYKSGDLIAFPCEDTATVIPRIGEALSALRMTAAALDIDTRRPGWTADVAREVARTLNEHARTGHAHRQALREIAAATHGKRADEVPACFEPDAKAVAEEVRRMHADRTLLGQLVENAALRATAMEREIEGLRCEMAKVRG